MNRTVIPSSTLALATFVAGAVSLSGCFFTDDDCAVVQTDCWDVCDVYCDAWGCWEECYTECEDICIAVEPPASGYVPVWPSYECVRDSDCGAGAWCGPQNRCTALPDSTPAGLCEPCEGQWDCAPGALCLDLDPDGETGFCGRACEADRDCPVGYGCDATAGGPQCVPDAGTCEARTPVPGCDRDAQCGAGEVCEGGSCVEIGNDCRSDRDCDVPAFCIDGACELLGACADTGDCGIGETCDGGLCRPASDACGPSAPCEEGLICQDGACVLPPGVCRSDRDCVGDERCLDSVCTAPPQRETCTFSAECADEEACVDGLCRSACTDSAECEADETCRGGICAPRPAPECLTNLDCGDADALCIDGSCAATCETVHDCGVGYLCSDGLCTPDPEVECRMDEECALGQSCVGGECFSTCHSSCTCPEGLTCDGDTGLCEDVPMPESCATDCDCPGGTMCIDGACVE